MFIVEIEKDPPSEINNAESISTSLVSWLTFIVKSAKTPHVKSDNEITTVGVNEVQFNINGISWEFTSPNYETIVVVKFTKPVFGLS